MEYRLPDLGEGIDEAEIVRWLVQPGDRVARDQPVAQVQTDKALVDLPAPAAGVIGALGGREGDRLKVGGLVVSIVGDGEAVAQSGPAGAAGSQPIAGSGSEAGSAAAPEVVQGIVGTIPGEEPIGAPSAPLRPAGAQPAGNGSPPPALGPAATPATRRLARELAVDLASVRGTGPGGRITDADVRAARAIPANAPAQAAAGVIPIRGLRRRIAERMEQAARIPRVTMMDEADASALVALRLTLGPAAEAAGVRLGYLPIISKLVMAALALHPSLNAHYDEVAGEIRSFASVDLGIATATGDGLVVPVVRGADRMGLLELASTMQARADGARQRRLGVEDLRGSTFTVTSPGPGGGLFATPLLNPPEVAILAIGRIEERAAVRDGQVLARATLPFSLTFDHRAIDGADATAFAATFTALVATPARLLL
ncbi:MAG TPA: dihydrolipoamide acetyltransferase family protein [Bacillota bacterium]|nr:dihydrolipoamide acetyltransferase family protein [Bacillota bacterium]